MMYARLLKSESRKNFYRSILWIEVGIMAVLVLLINFVLFATVQYNLGGGQAVPPEARSQFLENLVWPGSLLSALSFAGNAALGGLMVVVLVGALTAQDYPWRIFHLWVSRGTNRTTLLAAKFSALLWAVLLLTLVPLVAGGLVTIYFSYATTGELALEQVNGWQVLWGLLRTAYSLLPYAALTFLVAVWTRSLAGAIGIGLAYTVIIENVTVQLLMLMGGWAVRIRPYLPGGLAESLTSMNQAIFKGIEVSANTPVGDLLSPVGAAIGIGTWTLAMVGLALVVFLRQDLTE